MTKITSEMVKSPEYTIGVGPQRRATSKDWLLVEAEFAVQVAPPAKFVDDLTVTYYIALNAGNPQNPRQPAVLVGTVSHTAIPTGKGLHSAAFVSPRTLERFFEGKTPAAAQAAVLGVGVTLSSQGQLLAELSDGKFKGQRQWWSQLTQLQGYVLNKNETPFAPLFSDYYEAIKSKQ